MISGQLISRRFQFFQLQQSFRVERRGCKATPFSMFLLSRPQVGAIQHLPEVTFPGRLTYSCLYQSQCESRFKCLHFGASEVPGKITTIG